MRCAACGQLILEGTKYCPSCGAKIEEQAVAGEQKDMAFDDAVGTEQPDDHASYTFNQNNYTANNNSYTVYEHEQSHQPDMPMKWYKFLIYVSLLLTGASNVFTGIQTVMGMQYWYDGQSLADQIYGTYAGLKIVDIVYGIVIIAMGVFAFVVRQKLAHYRKDGPKSLLMLYGVSLVVAVIYIIVMMLVTGINVLTASTIMNLVMAVVMMIVNKIYFDKRMHLFTE